MENLSRQRARISWRDNETRHSVHHLLPASPNVRGHHGQAASHRFDHAPRKALAIGGKNEDVGSAKIRRRTRHLPGQVKLVRQAKGADEPVERVPELIAIRRQRGSDHEVVHIVVFPAYGHGHVEKLALALLLYDSADDADERRIARNPQTVSYGLRLGSVRPGGRKQIEIYAVEDRQRQSARAGNSRPP